MGDDAQIKFDSAQWEKYLKQIQKKWKDPESQKEFIAIVSVAFTKDYADHFETTSGPEGAWKPWSEAYKKHLAAIGKGGNKLLQDSGRLRQSFVPGNARAQKDGVMFYNTAPYAAAHDDGGAKLPQRKFMWLSDKAMTEISEQVGVWLAED